MPVNGRSWGFNGLCRKFCDVLRMVSCLGGLWRLRLVLGM